MKEIRTFILEDDPVMQNVLKAAVERTPGLVLLGVSGCPLRAGAMMAALPVDLLLLDIGLPELDGYRYLEALPRKPVVIVVSAHADNAVQAFDHAAVDFLCKPFRHERFLKAVQRAMVVLNDRVQEPAATVAPATSVGHSAGNGNGTLLLKSGKRMVPVRMDAIEVVQSVGNYVKLYLTDGALLASITMQAIEQLLPGDRFVRVHRSHIVAYRAIRALDVHGVEWRDGQLPFGALYKRHALSAIREHLSQAAVR
jgi:DNA-binding LytR/AlgR family response regulator